MLKAPAGRETTADAAPHNDGFHPTRRRVVATALGGGGAVALAACGQAQSGSSQTGTTGGTVTGKALFWQWGAGYVDGFTTLVKEYNAKNTGVQIDFDPGVVSAGSTDYWQKLTSAIAGNVAPDVFLMNTNARTWSSQGLLRPVDDLIKKDKTANDLNQSVNKAFFDWYTQNGKQMGWPWDYSCILTIYNLGHLKEAGLKPPAELGDKFDWNTYRDYAQKLTKTGTRWGGYAAATAETCWLNFVRANGGDYFSEDRKKCILGSPQAIEAIEYLSGLVVKDRTSPTRQDISANTNNVNMFVNGLISMGTFGDWSITDILKQGSSTLEWDATTIPFKNGKTGSDANLRGLVINSQSKNVDQAFDFMKFMLTKGVQDRITPLFGEVPARLDSANDVYLSPDKAGPPKGRTTLKPSILATQALPAADKTTPGDFNGISNAVMNDIWDGKISAKEGLTQAQDQVNQLLQKNGG